MIRTGTLQASLDNRRDLRTPSGTAYAKSDFIVSEPEDAVAPQAYLVEQEPNSTIHAHFHQENQFQVVVDGSATIGRHEVAPVSVHYANRHTGYGPINAGPQGVSYLTLRDHVTANAYYLPESRPLMEDLPRRNRFAERVAVSTADTLRARTDNEVAPLIEPEADGLAAWVVRIAPLATAALPDASGDRFHIVIAGSLERDGKSLPPMTIVFASDDEAPLALRASAEGCEVLVLQYPRNEARSKLRLQRAEARA